MKLLGAILIGVAISVAILGPLTALSMKQNAQVMQEAKAFDGLVVKVLDLQVLERGDNDQYRQFRLIVGKNADAKRSVWYIGKNTQPYTYLEENAVIPGDAIAVSYHDTIITESYVSVFSFLRFSKPPP